MAYHEVFLIVCTIEYWKIYHFLLCKWTLWIKLLTYCRLIQTWYWIMVFFLWWLKKLKFFMNNWILFYHEEQYREGFFAKVRTSYLYWGGTIYMLLMHEAFKEVTFFFSSVLLTHFAHNAKVGWLFSFNIQITFCNHFLLWLLLSKVIANLLLVACRKTCWFWLKVAFCRGP